MSNANFLTENQTDYVIYDTKSVDEKYYSSEKHEFTNFPILFLGILNDTVKIDHKLYLYPIPPPPPPTIIDWLPLDNKQSSNVTAIDSIRHKKLLAKFEKEYRDHPLEEFRDKFGFSHNKKTIINTKSALIKVDTINKISKHNFSHEEYYKAYPIIISNTINDTILIGNETSIPLVVEAKDSLNNWIGITRLNYHGHPSEYYYYLPPGYSLISSTYITNGDYQTKLRIRLGSNYSNEWTGKINYSQFSIYNDWEKLENLIYTKTTR